MKTRSALLAAIACGAAAILLVGVDLTLNVDATLEVLSGGTWQEVASTKDSGTYARGPVCGQDFRLTVHNGMPWSSKVAITLVHDGGNAAHQTWTLSAGETRSSEVYHLNGTLAPGGGPAKGFSSLQVQVGDDFFASANACPEATA
jgi:hypothetical protein